MISNDDTQKSLTSILLFNSIGVIEDSLTKKDRVILTGFDDFEKQVCSFFESAISETFRLDVSSSPSSSPSSTTSSTLINEDDEQKFMLNALHFSSMGSVVLDQDVKALIEDQSKLFLRIEEKVKLLKR